MAHAQEKLPAVNAAFISTTFIGATAGNLMKGFIWGGVAGLSQSLGWFWRPSVCDCFLDYAHRSCNAPAGTAYFESAAAAKAASKAVDINAFKSLAGSKAKVLIPSMIG